MPADIFQARSGAVTMLWRLLLCCASLSVLGVRGVLFRHGGELNLGTSAPQREWDPDKMLIRGKDVMAETVSNTHSNTEGAVNHTVQQGTTAFLPCRVRHVGDKKVTWIRRRDYHILTSGIQTQTLDERFSVVRGKNSDDWLLQIKFVQQRDHGLYECQVPTKTGRNVYQVFLNVVVPKASILGSKELHVQSGSTISLVCVIDGTIEPSPFVFWFHNQKMINYDQQRGGINVVTEHEPSTSTRLTIADATYSDSGNYTCSASNTNSSVNVFVSEGDKTAAIQRLGGSESISVMPGHIASLVTLLVVCWRRMVSLSGHPQQPHSAT